MPVDNLQRRCRLCGYRGVKPLLCCLILSLLLLAPARASLATAREAQATLGPDVWSRLIKIDNTASKRTYPRTVYAVVFEFGGLLWFYCDTDGTQSFSLHRGKLAEEKADFGPLLRDIDAGFTSYTVVADSLIKPASHSTSELPNGCFVKSVATFHRFLEGQGGLAQAALLSYYLKTSEGLKGHTVFVFTDADGSLGYVDPVVSPTVVKLPSQLRADPLAVARAVQGPDALQVAQARWVTADVSTPRPDTYANRGVASPAFATAMQ